MGPLEKQTDPTSPMHWRGDMQADYFYPSGIAGDKFFKHLMEKDTFLATKCKVCNKILFPPRLYCEDCFEEIPDEDWMEVPASGKVKLFTKATLNAHGVKMEEPKVIAVIEIDNTDSTMLGIIKTNELDKDFFGVRVKAVLRPKDKREGTLKDILFWQVI
ncbi:MAG: Zn-ribbon domain-containing OB-fold protein [Deltaproteobacteria bacterium]|nr:Zn-ribbon domain-containing OB-fold protein [Deltaproteobacteria bacterium]